MKAAQTRRYQNNIPGVVARIDHVLDRQRLVPMVSPGAFIRDHHGKKHRYTSACRTRDGSKVIFYARLHKNMDARQKFRREILFLRSLERSASPLRKYVPKLYASSTVHDREWFTREYLQAPALGSVHLADRPLGTTDVPRIIQLFSALRHIPDNRLFRPLERRGGDFYLNMTEGCLRTASKLFTRKENAGIHHMMHDAYDLLDAHAKYRVHGDCHPGNILITPTKIYLIDWELLHINNRVNDIAYFYAGLAEHPVFRKKLISSFERSIEWKEEFRTLFPVVASFFSINHLCTLLQDKPDDLSEHDRTRVMSYARAIVKSSLNGYTTVAKL